MSSPRVSSPRASSLKQSGAGAGVESTHKRKPSVSITTDEHPSKRSRSSPASSPRASPSKHKRKPSVSGSKDEHPAKRSRSSASASAESAKGKEKGAKSKRRHRTTMHYGLAFYHIYHELTKGSSVSKDTAKTVHAALADLAGRLFDEVVQMSSTRTGKGNKSKSTTILVPDVKHALQMIFHGEKGTFGGDLHKFVDGLEAEINHKFAELEKKRKQAHEAAKKAGKEKADKVKDDVFDRRMRLGVKNQVKGQYRMGQKAITFLSETLHFIAKEICNRVTKEVGGDSKKRLTSKLLARVISKDSDMQTYFPGAFAVAPRTLDSAVEDALFTKKGKKKDADASNGSNGSNGNNGADQKKKKSTKKSKSPKGSKKASKHRRSPSSAMAD